MERSKAIRNLLQNSCDNRPSPYNFIEFLPWACKQYEIDVTVYCPQVISKQPPARKRKAKSLKSEDARDKMNSSSYLNFMDEDSTVRVMAIFDHTNSLISLKFEHNVKVPKIIFQVITLIIQFYPSLTSLSADKGLDAYCIHEITKILSKSSITEVCLDGTYLKNPNYYILLETVSNLNCLSLARCQISDETTKKIAENLAFPRPAAKTLTFLNLSSNRITDTGAAHLADALKTNRQLAYLNLADNRITDTGASHIFDIMLSFPIRSEDLKQSKIRRREYMKEKYKLFHKFATELKIAEKQKSVKRKGYGKLSVVRGKTSRLTQRDQHKDKTTTEDWNKDKVSTLKLLAQIKVNKNLDEKILDRAKNLALQAIGPFEDPFVNLFVKDEIAYCTGNNTLACLNLACNNLSYCSLRKLIKVLNYQKNNQQTPRGVFRVRLEGNYLPLTCEEYTEIKGLLDLALEATNPKQNKGPKSNIIQK